MADHHKPLFHRKLLDEAQKPYLSQAEIGEPDANHRAIAAKWAAAAHSLLELGVKEKPLQGDLFTSLFDQLLGYRQVAGSAGEYHLKPETASREVKGARTPDAALGFYGGAYERTLAVVELKAPGADLDSRQAGYGNITPVEQAFNYAAKHDGCRWVLLCNFVTLRLYRTARGQGYCHEFRLADLSDEPKLREFSFLLGRETLLGDGRHESPVERLAGDTHVAEERITKAFYLHYRGVRGGLFQHLIARNPAAADDPERIAAHEEHLLEQAQKILDRVLFIAFCEDTGLLPAQVLRQVLTVAHGGFVQVTRWQQFIGLCNAVDQGQPALRINAYNGGLFAKDPALDALQVDDQALTPVLELADYDFATDLNVNILGHIFEQSIADLENLRAEIRGEAVERAQSKRKKDGVFYTPERITRLMVSRTIGGWLQECFERLEAEAKAKAAGGLRSTAAKLKLWRAYREALAEIKVVDPACGSGAFLVAAFDFLHAEYARVNRRLAEIAGQPQQMDLFDLDRQILQQNLFGVDLNPESVEITKLSLWLKTARPDRPLNNLDANIRCGNSLLDPPQSPSLPGERSWGEENSSPSPRGRGVGVRADSDEQGPSQATAETPEALTLNPSPSGRGTFNWQTAFPQVFARGGFDCVIGNPPYVRQESLAPFKPWLQQHYAAYHGMGDLYLYFYELALRLLAPAGKAAYIVTNKWLRAGYGEPLRRLFSEQARFEEIIDFGHAPIFEDADTFPCIVVYGRSNNSPSPAGGGPGRGSDGGEERPDGDSTQTLPPTPSRGEGEKSPSLRGKEGVVNAQNSPSPRGRGVGVRATNPATQTRTTPELAQEPNPQVRVCTVPRDRDPGLSLEQFVEQHAHPVPWSRFSAEPWSLEPAAVDDLMAKIRARGVPLREFADAKPMFGIKTGLNQAFLIDDSTRLELINEDPSCSQIIRPYLRGRDLKRWSPEWQNLWILLIKSSNDNSWPWSDANEKAEEIFSRTYPSVYRHLKGFEAGLKKRSEKGRFWWELRSCSYYSQMDKTKIVYQDIAFHSRFGLSAGGEIPEATCFSLPNEDLSLLAILNSALMWWVLWRTVIHGKDDALRLKTIYMEKLPIAQLEPPHAEIVREATHRLIDLAAEEQKARAELLHWLRLEHQIEKPGQKLTAYPELDADTFAKEVKKRRPKSAARLGPKDLAELRETHAQYAEPARIRAAETRKLEHQIAKLIYQAYGLTEKEIQLIHDTAPPRMPPG